MNKIKKIGALFLALVIILALSVSAFAADGDTPNSNYNGTAEGNPDLAKLTDQNEISITKDIVLFNAEASKIYAPNVSYTYAVAPAETTANSVQIEGITLEDNNNPHKTTTITVRNGIAGGVLLANAASGTGAATTTISFTNGDALDSAFPLTEGTEATTENAAAAKTSKNLYIQFAPTAIYNNGANPAGIYRYKITDTTTRETLANAGILRNDAYDDAYKTLYLDVYLKNVETNGAVTGLEVYGYVLFKSGTKDTPFQYVSGSTESYKLTGFNVASEIGTASGNTTPVISDQYHTYNLKVTKTTDGQMADKSHYFPFDITLTEAATNTATKVYAEYADAQDVKDGSGTAVNTASGTMLSAGATATNFTGKMKNGGYIKFNGIPSYITYTEASDAYTYTSTAYATANAKETNDTYDFYSATATVDQESSTNIQLTYKAKNADAAETDTTATAHAAVLANTGYAKLKTALSVDGRNSSNAVIGNSIDFKNTLDAISPTGVVLRVAPYVLMLAAGVVLLVLSRKRKKAADAA